MQDKIKNAEILLEALPYIREFNNQPFVIKYGGSTMVDPVLRDKVAQDIVLLKLVGINVIVVHGGGKHINEVIAKYGITPVFKNGLRVTDSTTMEIAEMVLSGKANKDVVTLINKHGGRAVGISGKDGPLLMARRYQDESGEDYGQVGVVEDVRTDILETLDSNNFIPVISPVAVDTAGTTYNVNADQAAGMIARAVGAAKLIFLTDVQGVYRDPETRRDIASTLSRGEALELIKTGAISGGMLPKVRSILECLDNGVKKVHIINGTIPHALLLEIFTQNGIGTEFHLGSHPLT